MRQCFSSGLEPGDLIGDNGAGARVEAECAVHILRVLPRDPGPLRAWEEPARLAARTTINFFTVSARTVAKDWPVLSL
jgi:hypothetical protein